MVCAPSINDKEMYKLTRQQISHTHEYRNAAKQHDNMNTNLVSGVTRMLVQQPSISDRSVALSRTCTKQNLS